MKPLIRRLEALETVKGDALSSLNDDEIRDRLFAVIERLIESGVILPSDWRVSCEADPASFQTALKTQIEAMQQ